MATSSGISFNHKTTALSRRITPKGKRVSGWTPADGGRHGGSRRGNVEGYRRQVVPELRADLDALHQVERGVGVGVARA
jgi:hypothetical protein